VCAVRALLAATRRRLSKDGTHPATTKSYLAARRTLEANSNTLAESVPFQPPQQRGRESMERGSSLVAQLPEPAGL